MAELHKREKNKALHPGLGRRFTHIIRENWQLYLLLLPALLYFIVFYYYPMYGVQIAFRQYRFVDGITGSKWVGIKHFKDFMSSYYFGRLLSNTFLLNLLGLLISFPIPVVLAILINQLEFKRFKRFSQTAIYTPHFISTTVIVGMLYLFLSPTNGIANHFIENLGGQRINFMLQPEWFRPLYIITEVWQHAGWNTILYIAALTAIDPQLYEASTIDGASKRQKILHIELPHLLPIMLMMLILNTGSLLSSNTDKALLMQTAGNMATSDIIGVYVYQMGLGKAQFSYTSAIGLFINIINFFMILSVNGITKRISKTSLF